MTTLTIQIHETDYLVFKSKVGAGNVSATIRNFITSYTDDKKDLSIAILKRKLPKIEGKFKEAQAEYNAAMAKLKQFEEKQKAKELKELEKAKEIQEEMNMANYRAARQNLDELVPK